MGEVSSMLLGKLRARFVAAGWALVSSYGLAVAQPVAGEATAPTPQVVVSCSKEGCGVVLPPQRPLEQVELCFEDLDASRAVPRLLLRGGGAMNLSRKGEAWCAVVKPGEALAVNDRNRTRPLTSLKADSSVEDPTLPISLGQWAEVKSSELTIQTLDGQPVLLEVPTVRELEKVASKEPILTGTLPPPSLKGPSRRQFIDQLARQLEATPKDARGETTPPPSPEVFLPPPPPRREGGIFSPDDVSFLDVVLVGDLDGYHCSGILVAPWAALTAAHCAPATVVAIGYRIDRPLLPSAVREVVAHPSLDVALLLLDKPLPAPLRARRRAVHSAPPVGVVRMVGFGVDNPRFPSSFGVKRRTDAMVQGWGCDGARARSTGCLSGMEMTIADVGGRDTCMGDSGGPVLELVDGALRLLAITSRPTRSGGAVCGRGGIYVRLDVLDEWLTSILEKNS